MAFRFYFMKKDIGAQSVTTAKPGITVAFHSKMAQAAEMLYAVASHFQVLQSLVVTNGWFGNDGLLRPLKASGYRFDRLSRLRSNINLYDLPP